MTFKKIKKYLILILIPVFFLAIMPLDSDAKYIRRQIPYTGPDNTILVMLGVFGAALIGIIVFSKVKSKNKKTTSESSQELNSESESMDDLDSNAEPESYLMKFPYFKGTSKRVNYAIARDNKISKRITVKPFFNIRSNDIFETNLKKTYSIEDQTVIIGLNFNY